jgi:hypothetical protein
MKKYINKYILTYKIFESDYRNPMYRDFTNNIDLKHKLMELDTKKFNELYSKHKWYLINKNKKHFKNNLFTLVNIAYDSLGGHVTINEPDNIENNNINFWTAIDINNDPYADIVIFGKKTKFGIKISGFGHNFESDSKKNLFNI